MAFVKTVFFIALICIMGINAQAGDDQKQYSPVIRELKELYNAQPAFKDTIDRMFQNLQETQKGAPNPWLNKNINDLCDWMEHWLTFIPAKEGELKYIRTFQTLYYRNPYGLKFVKEEPGASWVKKFSEARGRFMDSPESARLMTECMKDPLAKVQDYIIPEGGFKTFNEFFTRHLKPGIRPVGDPEDESVIVAPADCLLQILNMQLTEQTSIPTKPNQELNIKNLLDNSQFTKHFIGGTAVKCILEPYYYHHFHAPVGGVMVESRENVAGLYYDNREDFSVFEHYRRGYYIIKTSKFGYVAMIPVGLATVGSVKFEDKFRDVVSNKPVPVEKGERLGHFAFGGSLVILLFEPNRLTFLNARQGQRIGVFENTDDEM